MQSVELQLVEWLRTELKTPAGVELGVGDDMAIVHTGAGSDGAPRRVLLSSDMLLDGVHFDTSCHDVALIGRKAVACALSDCAAMAARPLAATLSVALPRAWPLAKAKTLVGGAHKLAERFGLALVGGDTTRWDRPLAIDVAVTAVPQPGIEPVLRSGAKVGDTLYVTGPLGGSLLGKHLTFTPRVAEAERIARHLESDLHAMLDISDGLSLDAWRMCRASKVGAQLDERLLETIISDDARAAAASDGQTPLAHALHDGEDFELLLASTIEPDAMTEHAARMDLTLHPVGTITVATNTEETLTLVRSDGRSEPLCPKGYVH